MQTRDPGGELCARAAAGDRAAMTGLVAAFRGPLYRFARRLTRDDALAEDVLQETFLTALKKVGGWRGEGTCKGWLFASLRSQVLMARRRWGVPETFDDVEAGPELPQLGLEAGWGAAMDPEALASRMEAQAQLERAWRWWRRWSSTSRAASSARSSSASSPRWCRACARSWAQRTTFPPTWPAASTRRCRSVEPSGRTGRAVWTSRRVDTAGGIR
jgi:RNA polymerase sigma-70 factor (ECF subfamily)